MREPLGNCSVPLRHSHFLPHFLLICTFRIVESPLMQLESLKVFCDLATLRSFSKAAEANGVSQPTVTRLVHQLEERLGGQLIDRSKRPLQLTPLGQAYYAGLQAAARTVHRAGSVAAPRPGEAGLTVRVAAIYSVGLWDMGQYVERFAGLYPHAASTSTTCIRSRCTSACSMAPPTWGWCPSRAVARADGPAVARGGDGASPARRGIRWRSRAACGRHGWTGRSSWPSRRGW